MVPNALDISATQLLTFADTSLTRRTLDRPRSANHLISLDAVCERKARSRTSPATTANPRPDSPARAASTAAL